MISPDHKPASGTQSAPRAPEGESSGATASRSVGDGADASFSQSNALSFVSFRRGQVDPRTGSFNYRIPIAKLTGNRMMGPTMELNLKYDHFIKRDEGFGEGWTFGFSRVIDNNSQKKVVLRDGRIIDLTADGDAYTTRTIGIKDFKFSKLNSPAGAYQIVYKDGSAEMLEAKGALQQYVILTKLTGENGFSLNLEYDETSSIPWLKRIYDEAGTDLLSVERDFRYDDTGYLVGTVTVNFYPGSESAASSMKLTCQSDAVTQTATMRSCAMQFDTPLAVVKLSYAVVNGFCLITQAESNFTGLATETVEYNANLTAPPGAPWESLPAVSSHLLSMPSSGTGNTKQEKHTYTYGGGADTDNFLGFNGVTSWDNNAVDNIYSCPSDYDYTSTDKLALDGVEIHSTIRVYDKFHRAKTETVELPTYTKPETSLQFDRKVKSTYTYPGDTTTAYASLPAQYKLPTQVDTTYTDEIKDAGIKAERTTTQTASFDEFGNVLSQGLSGGMTSDFTYYPAEGTKDQCPAEKNGFVRYVNTMTKHKSGVSTDLIKTTCTYKSTRVKDDCDYVVLMKEEEKRTRSSKELKEFRIIDYTYYSWDDESTAANKGRLKYQETRISNPAGIRTTYKYEFSADNTRFTITSDQTGVTETDAFSEQKQVSALTGWLLKLVDNVGISTTSSYDKFGRMISLTRAAGSAMESVTTYSYSVDDSGVQTRTKQIPTMSAVVETFDALGNVVSEVTAGRTTRKAEYNTRGLLVTEILHDESVPMIEDNVEIDKSLDITSLYEYDAFDNLTKVTYQNGSIFNRRFEIGTAKLKEYWTGKDMGEEVHFDCTETLYDLNNMLPMSVSECHIDGETFTSKTSYAYDVFFRLNELKVIGPDDHVYKHHKYAYDFCDRIFQREEYEEGELERRVTSVSYWKYGSETKLTSLSVNKVLVAKRTYDGLGRLVTIQRNPDASPPANAWNTLCVYDAGRTTPNTISSPRNLSCAYTYFDELGGLVKSITPEQGASFNYLYDISKLKLFSETITSTAGSQTRYCGYDANGLLISELTQTQLNSEIPGKYQSTFERTESGRIKSISTIAQDNPTSRIGYFYDSSGRISRVSFSRSVSAEYNVHLQVDLTYYFGDLPAEAVYSFKKSDASDVKFSLRFGYDERLRLRSKQYCILTGDPPQYTDIATDDVEYDCLGQIISQYIEAGVEKKNVTEMSYGFDYLGRLISAKANVDNTTIYPVDLNGNPVKEFYYIYDEYDNITSVGMTDLISGDTEMVTFSYAGKNKFELTQISQFDSSGTKIRDIDVSHDESGNLTGYTWSDGSVSARTFRYDWLEKLSEIELGGVGTTTIGRNSQDRLLGERDEQTVDGVVQQGQATAYGYCGAGFSALWRRLAPSDTEVVVASYLRAATAVDAISVGKVSSGIFTPTTRMFQLSDVSGSVYAQVDPDADGIPDVQQLVYHPYGQVQDPQGPSEYDPVRFKGVRFDQLTALYHLAEGNRAYDPAMMRFLQYDVQSPFGEGGINPYAYCMGDPVTYADLTGESRTLSIVLGAAAVAVSFVGLLGAMGGLLAAAAAAKGMTASAAITGALGVVSNVTGVVSGATGIASAVHEGELSEQLGTASYVLGVASLVTAWLPIGVSAFRFAQKLQAAEALAVNASVGAASASVASRAISAALRVAGGQEFTQQANLSFLLARTIAHRALRSSAFQGAMEATRYYYLLDGSGPLALLASSAAGQGVNLNAKELVALLGRPDSAIPCGQLLCDMPGSPFPGVDAEQFGVPWFPKLMSSSPRVRALA
ncbi:RHS repeat-associated core domain-containing protein [Paraburkholderia humisilvae]|uniref:Uncharacterized protein n=1 Tax=Paraburkholderia humisilvae TaxID=627669 RepID=A0A6J5E1Q3_9BURK|nr:RHS repeat-associated core domain-containing protein [Paraburkholderia humisilvae]CAB3760400.1 hypothetical protein LMG29542_03834 [Paraburkholderia humisilvae]